MEVVETRQWDSNGGAVSCFRSSAVPQWYAVQTRCRYERKIVDQLERKGVLTFLPLMRSLHQWSDRRKRIDSPLFPGYVFVHMAVATALRLAVLQTTGVIRFVGNAVEPAPVTNKQIDDIRALLASRVLFGEYPFLRTGDRVRVRGGALEGLEGILVRRNQDLSLVISIEPIQRSISVPLQGYSVEPI